jgi:phosphonate transport system ATP-binding protein
LKAQLVACAVRQGLPHLSRLALQPFTLTVEAGEQVAVIGPSGAGKTTLLHALACSLKPASGSLQLAGRDPWQLTVRELQQLRSQLFLAPQVPPLPPRQRVVTAVLAGMLPHMGLVQSLLSLLHPMAYPAQVQAAHAALAQFDLADKLWHRVDRLSGGERQRVALARALVSSATLWLVDEPLSALDPARAQQAMQTLTHAAHEQGATLIATLHQVDMALQHFPRIVGLKNGELAFDLPTQDVSRERLELLYANHLDELDAATS